MSTKYLQKSISKDAKQGEPASNFVNSVSKPQHFFNYSSSEGVNHLNLKDLRFECPLVPFGAKTRTGRSNPIEGMTKSDKSEKSLIPASVFSFSLLDPPLGDEFLPIDADEEPPPTGTSSDFLLSSPGSGASLSRFCPIQASRVSKSELDPRSNSPSLFTPGFSSSASNLPGLHLLQEAKKAPKLNSSSLSTLTSNAAPACPTTITTRAATACTNGSTPRGCSLDKNRWKYYRETSLLILVFLLSICSTSLLVLYLRAMYDSGPVEHEPNVCWTPDCLRAASRILDRMDRTVSPCDDFYHFTCGNYVAKNVVPDDAPYRSAMQEMQEEVLVIIRKMLTDDSSQANESEAVGRAKRLYQSCINTNFTVYEKDMGESPIFDLLTEKHLGVWPLITHQISWNDSLYDLERLLAQLTLYQVHTFFASYILPDERNSSIYTLQFYQGSPALSRTYYLNTSNEEYVGYVSAYRALMEEVVTSLHGNSDFNTSQIDDLIAFETKFAEISDSRSCDPPEEGNATNGGNGTQENISDTEEDEGIMRVTVAELDEIIPEIKWTRLLELTFHQFEDLRLDPESLMVTLHCTSYVPDLINLLAETPNRVIVNYLLWRFILRYLPYISNYFQQLWQQFRNEVPDPFEERTYTSRWKECAALVNEGFGAALAGKYVDEYYDDHTSTQIDKIVEEVRAAFYRIIQRQSWLQEDMKDVCSDKLYLMGKKIGYPEYIHSKELLDAEFDGLDILDDHFLNNVLKMKRHEVWKELQKLSRPVDKKRDWLIQPLIVNAFHNPTANEIILPLGILREPFYNHGYPMYLNYGSLGVVVGHELVHGFDNHGKKYDKHGNVSQWWSGSMVEAFTDRALCFIDQYSQFPIEMVGKNVDGNETLGDNICDNTGLLNAWEAYQNWVINNEPEPLLPGLNYTISQVFLIAFGQIWCEVVSKEGYEKYSTDMHSPGVHRTNGVAQNSEFFANTWNCPVGSPMNPEKKCKLWV